MKLSGVYDESMSNGLGWRGVIFVSGCPHNCLDCHNKEAQNYSYGEDYCIDTLVERFATNSILKGVTISGGEPLCPENIKNVLEFIKKMKKRKPRFNIWCYTGYTLKELKQNSLYYKDILLNIDILVDGPFKKELYDPNLKFRGSSNQRIIDLKDY